MDWPKPTRGRDRSRRPEQATTCPPACPAQKKRVRFMPETKQERKQVRFTPDTKPGSSRSSRDNSNNNNNEKRSVESDKTRYPFATPKRPSPPTTPGLSSIRRDFDTRRTVPRPQQSAPRARQREPDVHVSIPVRGPSYEGPPKGKDRCREGYEWVKYRVTVTPMERG